jgi:hypothetical protein
MRSADGVRRYLREVTRLETLRPQGEPAKADRGIVRGIFERVERRLRFDLVAGA